VASLPLKARELMRNIHKRVFMTFLRMATNKESSVSYKKPPCYLFVSLKSMPQFAEKFIPYSGKFSREKTCMNFVA
jgi:hypothetical protein